MPHESSLVSGVGELLGRPWRDRRERAEPILQVPRRRQAQAPLIEGWRDRLPEGLSPARAADILWALTSPEVYTLLVVESGWSGDAYQEWLEGTLTRQLLGSP